MMRFWLNILFLSIIFGFLAIAADELLSRAGLARQNRIVAFVGALILALVYQLAGPAIPLWIAWPLMLFLLLLGLHRAGFIEAIFGSRPGPKQDEHGRRD